MFYKNDENRHIKLYCIILFFNRRSFDSFDSFDWLCNMLKCFVVSVESNSRTRSRGFRLKGAHSSSRSNEKGCAFCVFCVRRKVLATASVERPFDCVDSFDSTDKPL